MAKTIEKTIKEKRIDQLEELGFNLNEANNTYEYKNLTFLIEGIEDHSEQEWEKLISVVPPDESIKLELTKTEQKVMNVDFAAETKQLEVFKEKAISFKRKYGPTKLNIKGVTDKAGLEKNKEAGRELLEFRQEVEAYIETKIRPLLDTAQWYKDNLGTLVKAIKELQDAAKAKRDAHKLLVEDEKNKETIRLQNLLTERVDILIKAGMAFDGSFYSIGSDEFGVPTISLGAVDIQSMTDAVWPETLELIKGKVSTIAAKQKEKDDEAEKARLKKIKDDADRDAELKEAQKEILDTRRELLLGLDMEETETHFVYEDQQVSKEFVSTYKSAEWQPLFSTLKAVISEKKANALKEKVIAERSEQLMKIMGFGINQKTKTYEYPGVELSEVINEDYLVNASDNEWKELIAESTQKIEAYKNKKTLLDERHNQLTQLGLKLTPLQGYFYKGNEVKTDLEVERDEWIQTLANISKTIGEIDAAIALQTKRFNELTPLLQQLHTVNLKELYLLSETEYAALYDVNKKAYDKKIADDLQLEADNKETERKANLAKEGDKAIWEDFISRLKAISFPETKSPDYTSKVSTVKKYIDSLS